MEREKPFSNTDWQYVCREPGREIAWRTDKKTTLFESNQLHPALVPEDTDTVRHAIFRYRLTDRPKCESMSVSQGHTIDYEREAHAPVLEPWFRRSGILKQLLAAWAWIMACLGQFLSDAGPIVADCADEVIDFVT